MYRNLWVEYSNFISAALAQWKGAKILEFSIFFPSFRSESYSDIDSWLRFAIEKQVEKLTISRKWILSFVGFDLNANSCCYLQFLVDTKKNNMPVQFPNAEFLKLCVYNDHQMLDVLVVLESFPKLKTLIVHQNGYMHNSVASEMAFRSPSLLHLQRVEIYIHENHFSISPLVKFLLENAQVLEKMVVQPHGEQYDQEAFTSALKELLGMRRSSPYAEVIISPD
ncbi:uncharacterized protein LOC130993060 [Salvia miltiorrhiza]|uniref:uncharacterized protein LOC130993060 n=1 Tax=Salvia miltiorrhiza TaxID=226208 RepID=UPI0025AD8FEE|nr:uncharacterized protein LOC130993060 [Salvia miltiorrhiza]